LGLPPLAFAKSNDPPQFLISFHGDLIHFQPPENLLPNAFQLNAAKEQVINIFLIVTEAALLIDYHTKLLESIFCCQPAMTRQPEDKQSSRPSHIMVHSLSPNNHRVIHFQQLVNFSSGNFPFMLFHPWTCWSEFLC
jgi:hypothetical protein